MADFLELEDGSGTYLLEDGSGSLLLEESSPQEREVSFSAAASFSVFGSEEPIVPAGGVVVDTFGPVTGTGTMTVSGLPFQPVAVIFWNVADDFSPPGMMLGCASDVGQEWVIWAGVDTEISSYTKKYNEGRTDCCIFQRHAPYSSVSYQANLDSFTSDGFVIDVTSFTQPGEEIGFLAMGGSEYGGAYAGTFSAGGSTGATAITDPGFQPKAMLFAQLTTAFDSGRLTPWTWGVGVTDGVTQYSSFARAIPASTHCKIDRTDAVACATNGSDDFRMALDSFDPTGFTVDVVDAGPFGNFTQAYLAIDCTIAAAGFETIPDSTGPQTLDTPGFKAAGAFFCWNGVNVPVTTGSCGNQQLRPGVGGATALVSRAVSSIVRDNFPFGVYTTDAYYDFAAVSLRGQGTGIGGGDNDILASASWGAAVQDLIGLEWDFAQAGFDRRYGWLALPGQVPTEIWLPPMNRYTI